MWSGLHLLFLQQQPQSCLQSCGAVSTFFFLQCSSHSPACRGVEQAPPSPSGPRRHPAVPLRPCCHQAAPASFGNQSGPHLVGRWIKYSDDAIVLPSPPLCSPRCLRAAVAALVRPSAPFCGPRRLHAALVAFMRPSPPSCGPRRLHAALAAFMRPSPPSCGLAAFMRPSPPSCGTRRPHAALAAFLRASPPSCGPRRLRTATRAAITAPVQPAQPPARGRPSAG